MPEPLVKILLRTAPNTDISKVTRDTLLKADLGLTSLDFIVLMVEMQDQYGISIPETASFETVGDVLDFMNIKGDF